MAVPPTTDDTPLAGSTAFEPLQQIDLQELQDRLGTLSLPEESARALCSFAADNRRIFLLQVGKNIANINSAQNIKVGDSAELSRDTLRRAVEEAFVDKELNAWITALEDYWRALETLSEGIPYPVTGAESRRLLSEVYVEQQVEEYQLIANGRAPEQPAEVSQRQRLETASEALSRHRHIMFEAGPGMGKTSLLNSLINDAVHRRKSGEDPGFIPIFVLAQGLARRQGSLSTRLHSLLVEQLGLLLHNELPRDFFEHRDGKPPWLVLLDGLDEVIGDSGYEELARTIDLHVQAPLSPDRFVITSRPMARNSRLRDTGLSIYTLSPFGPRQVKRFAERWFAGGKASNIEPFLNEIAQSRIGELTQVPLLLTVAAVLFEDGREQRLPESRAALYRRFVEKLLDRMTETHEQFRTEWNKHFPVEGVGRVDALFGWRRTLLENLARGEHEQDTASLAEEAVRLAREAELLPDEADSSWLVSQMSLLLSRSGLIVHHAGKETFLHPTIREFLVGTALAREIAPESQAARDLLKDWNTPARLQVILFAVGIWGQRRDIVDEHLTFLVNEVEKGLLPAGLILAEGIRASAGIEERVIDGLIELARTSSIGDVFQWRKAALEGGAPAVPARILGMLRHRQKIGPALDEIARDRNVEEHARDAAVSALGRLAEKERLRNLLQTPDLRPSVHTHAAKALLQLGEAEDVAPLLIASALRAKTPNPERRGSWLENDVWNAYYAVRVLIDGEQPKHATTLLVNIARSRSYFEQARIFSARDLFSLGRERDALLLLLRQAEEPETSADMLLEISKVLVQNNHAKDACNILRRVTADASESLLYRQRAARELAGLGSPSEAKAFLCSVVQGQVPAIEPSWLREAAQLLSELGGDVSLPDELIRRAMDRSVSAGQRLRAAVELAQLRRREALPALRALTQERSGPVWVRAEAANQLYRRRSPLSVAAIEDGLMRLLRYPQRPQSLLAWAVERSGRPGSGPERVAAVKELIAANRIGELLALLSDPETDRGAVDLVRPLAGEALAKVCPPSDLVALAIDKSAAAEGRIEAAWALASGGHFDELDPAISSIMRDRSADVPFHQRRGAIGLLKALKDSEALVAILRDETLDVPVRIWAAEAALDLGAVDEVAQVARSNSTEAWTRVRIAERLGCVGREDYACPILLEIALDRAVTSAARAAGVSGLSQLGRVSELVDLASSASLDLDLRKEALWSLGDPAPAAAGALHQLPRGFVEGLPLELKSCAVDAITVGGFRSR